MKTVEQWEAQRREANDALSEIASKQRVQSNKALVGKHYRYHNSYSHDRRWWMFAKVTGVDRYGYPALFTFQTCSGDKIEIETKHQSMSSLGSEYQEITAAEFKKNWRALQRRIAKL